jgi:hypothetical protein
MAQDSDKSCKDGYNHGVFLGDTKCRNCGGKLTDKPQHKITSS